MVESTPDIKNKKKEKERPSQPFIDPLSAGGGDPLSAAASDPLSAAASDPLSAVLKNPLSQGTSSPFGAPAAKVRRGRRKVRGRNDE